MRWNHVVPLARGLVNQIQPEKIERQAPPVWHERQVAAGYVKYLRTERGWTPGMIAEKVDMFSHSAIVNIIEGLNYKTVPPMRPPFLDTRSK